MLACTCSTDADDGLSMYMCVFQRAYVRFSLRVPVCVSVFKRACIF